MKKKLWALALAVMLCLAPTVPAAADTTESGVCGESVTWSLDGGILTIGGTGPMENYRLRTSPWYSQREAIKTVTIKAGVTHIGEYAFYQCSNLTDVQLPAGLTSVGANAFLECESLKAVTVPDGVEKIGKYAFCTCINLAEVRLPDSITEIGKCAFSQCECLKTVNLPDGIPALESNLFSFCKSLTEIEIPDSVTVIGNGAFSHCSGLTRLRIPAGVTTIGDNAFESCTSLARFETDPNNPSYRSADGILYNHDFTELVRCPCTYSGDFAVPDSVVRILGYAFQGCTGLTNVSVPGSVAEIGSYAFQGCEKLTVLRLPMGLTGIARAMLADCTALTSLWVPAGVTRIEEYALWDCDKLRDIYYEGSSKQWAAILVEDYNDRLSAALMHFDFAFSGGVTVTVKDIPVQWTDVEPFIDANNRTMVPFRAVAETLGLDVNWDENAREAVFSNGDQAIYFPIGSNVARTSEGRTVTMDTAAVIVSDRTFAPVRALAEYFGYWVDWDPDLRCVLIG